MEHTGKEENRVSMHQQAGPRYKVLQGFADGQRNRPPSSNRQSFEPIQLRRRSNKPHAHEIDHRRSHRAERRLRRNRYAPKNDRCTEQEDDGSGQSECK